VRLSAQAKSYGTQGGCISHHLGISNVDTSPITGYERKAVSGSRVSRFSLASAKGWHPNRDCVLVAISYSRTGAVTSTDIAENGHAHRQKERDKRCRSPDP
jgi:hypothetical protein